MFLIFGSTIRPSTLIFSQTEYLAFWRNRPNTNQVFVESLISIKLNSFFRNIKKSSKNSNLCLYIYICNIFMTLLFWSHSIFFMPSMLQCSINKKVHSFQQIMLCLFEHKDYIVLIRVMSKSTAVCLSEDLLRSSLSSWDQPRACFYFYKHYLFLFMPKICPFFHQNQTFNQMIILMTLAVLIHPKNLSFFFFQKLNFL